ncbi:MAG: hypothetical protein ACRDPT_11550 [Streptomycetales bacterium]
MYYVFEVLAREREAELRRAAERARLGQPGRREPAVRRWKRQAWQAWPGQRAVTAQVFCHRAAGRAAHCGGVT